MDSMLPKHGDLLNISRKKFIMLAAGGLASTALSLSPFNMWAHANYKIKAIAFDAFPIFDPRPVFALVQKLFPEKGIELNNTWRTKQFEYCFIRTAAKQYKNFWEVTEDALVFAAHKTGVVLSNENKKLLMEQYLSLNTWPDVVPALQALKQKGVTLLFLSNWTPEMLESCIKHSKIEGYFDYVISTDVGKTYKPAADAYQLGADTLKLKKEEILFVAFACWDASGAKWYGYPTYWVNRLDASAEELNTTPDGIGKDLNDLLSYLQKQ